LKNTILNCIGQYSLIWFLLPESIIHIEFVEQHQFDKPLDNLPHGLEYLNLQFQNKYSHTISNLPNSIKYLELGQYNFPI
jgi:hypothetical protein